MATPAPSYIEYYPEPLPGGRAVMRVDLVVDGALVESHLDGSPAPWASVERHARRVPLTVTAERRRIAEAYRAAKGEAR